LETQKYNLEKALKDRESQLDEWREKYKKLQARFAAELENERAAITTEIEHKKKKMEEIKQTLNEINTGPKVILRRNSLAPGLSASNLMSHGLDRAQSMDFKSNFSSTSGIPSGDIVISLAGGLTSPTASSALAPTTDAPAASPAPETIK